MPRKQKITYSSLIDEQVSFNLYNDSLNSSNSDNIKSQYKILKLIIEEQLTAKQRRMLNMYYSLNLTMPQIAKIIGINKSTVSRSLKHSRETIKNYMKYNNFRQ